MRTHQKQYLLGVTLLLVACTTDPVAPPPGPTAGQPGFGGSAYLTIEGHVTSSINGTPIEGVRVEQLTFREDGAEQRGRSTTTDDRGYYRFDEGRCHSFHVRAAGNPGWRNSEPVFVESGGCRTRYRWHDFVLEPDT